MTETSFSNVPSASAGVRPAMKMDGYIVVLDSLYPTRTSLLWSRAMEPIHRQLVSGAYVPCCEMVRSVGLTIVCGVANSIQRTPICPPVAATSKFTYQCCCAVGKVEVSL